jgi:hypothetical protein
MNRINNVLRRLTVEAVLTIREQEEAAAGDDVGYAERVHGRFSPQHNDAMAVYLEAKRRESVARKAYVKWVARKAVAV